MWWPAWRRPKPPACKWISDRIENGAKWIGKAFAADPKLACDLRAYMQYALVVAGKPDAGALGQVFEQRSKLSPYGLAIFGLALELVKDARAAEIAARAGATRPAGCRAGMVDGHRATRCWISPRTPRPRPPPTP